MGGGFSIVSDKNGVYAANTNSKESKQPRRQKKSERVDIKAIEAQSELFQTCIANVTKALCSELSELRTENDQLQYRLEQQQHKMHALQEKYDKIEDELTFTSNFKNPAFTLSSPGGTMLTSPGTTKRTKNTILNLARRISANVKKKHSHNDLPPSLRDFTPLKQTPAIIAIIESNELKDAEQAVLKNPTSGHAVKALKVHVDKISKALKKTMNKRFRVPGIYDKCRNVERDGNASFLKVYDAIWTTVAENETKGLKDYRKIAKKVRASVSKGTARRQRHKKCVPLLQDAALVKPKFDETIKALVKNGQKNDSELEVDEVSIPTNLKRVARILEKAFFRREAVDNCDNTCDIVRGMIICPHMDDLAVILRLLHNCRAIVIVRMKERFEEEPTPGGWRDCMVNFYFKEDANKHICELQLVHHRIRVARTSMPGHAIYTRLRNAVEMQEALSHFEVYGLTQEEGAVAGVGEARRLKCLERVKHVKDVMKQVQTQMDKIITTRTNNDGKLANMNQRLLENSLENLVPQEYARQLRDLGDRKFSLPPVVLKTVMLAVLVILGVPNPKWDKVRPWLKKNKMCRALEKLDLAEVTHERIQEMEELFVEANLTNRDQVSKKMNRFGKEFTVLLWLYDRLFKIKNLKELKEPVKKHKRAQSIVLARVAHLNTTMARLKVVVALEHDLKAFTDPDSNSEAGEGAREKKLLKIKEMEKKLDGLAVVETQFAEYVRDYC